MEKWKESGELGFGERSQVQKIVFPAPFLCLYAAKVGSQCGILDWARILAFIATDFLQNSGVLVAASATSLNVGRSHDQLGALISPCSSSDQALPIWSWRPLSDIV